MNRPHTHCLWFRHDLRISANPIIEAAKKLGGNIIGVYAITPTTWKAHDWSPRKMDFVHAQLRALKPLLASIDIDFYVLELEQFNDIPDAFEALCKTHHVTDLHVNRHYGLDERRCETALKQRLSQRVNWHEFNGNWLLSPEKTLSPQGKPYQVFTAFQRQVLKSLPAFFHSAIGNTPAEEALRAFCADQLDRYHETRDFPDLNATSHLSHYLSQGILSPRQCVTAMLESTGCAEISALLELPGPRTWLSELIWRDFYQHLMFHHSKLSMGKAFKAETDQLNWSRDPGLFIAWCEGKTGFPLVDAGMRQLRQTGWMHNRLRMVTAMFLTKTLFIDWRWGERYFMTQLLDGDFAANNGGWQWCASTGTDAVPYFRIFNPTTQSERFDPEGHFIRKFCPELAPLSHRDIHNPTAQQRKACGYPEPIVDYSVMRAQVIQAFKALANHGS